MIYEICAGETGINWILIHNSKQNLEKLYQEFKELNLPINNNGDFSNIKTFVKWLIEKKGFYEPKVSFIILEN